MQFSGKESIGMLRFSVGEIASKLNITKEDEIKQMKDKFVRLVGNVICFYDSKCKNLNDFIANGKKRTYYYDEPENIYYIKVRTENDICIYYDIDMPDGGYYFHPYQI